MDTTDPVIRDTNRYLAQQDRADRLQTECDMLVDQWLSQPSKVSSAWARVMKSTEDSKKLKALLVEFQLRSGNFSGLEEVVANVFFGELITQMLRAALEEMALEHLEEEAEEARTEARIDDLEYNRSL